MPASWLVVIAWVALAIAFASSAAVLVDIYGRSYRQKMPIMEVVWPVTALYFGPAALWAYRRFGQPMSSRWRTEHSSNHPPAKPAWATTAVGVSHCGAGCTLGDIIAEVVVFTLGATIGGMAVYASMLADFGAALTLGIVFQYFAIAPMRGLGMRRGLIDAARADVLSLISFEIGLFAWMALMAFVFYPAPHQLRPNSPVYWFLMQIGMIIGFATAWPTNTWLIRRGIKEAM